MALVIDDNRAEVDRVRVALGKRMGMDDGLAADTLLGGSVSQVRDKLGRLRDAGVGMLWIPTLFLPKDPRPTLDRFMAEVAPSVR
jgi:hypothetical protein